MFHASTADWGVLPLLAECPRTSIRCCLPSNSGIKFKSSSLPASLISVEFNEKRIKVPTLLLSPSSVMRRNLSSPSDFFVPRTLVTRRLPFPLWLDATNDLASLPVSRLPPGFLKCSATAVTTSGFWDVSHITIKNAIIAVTKSAYATFHAPPPPLAMLYAPAESTVLNSFSTSSPDGRTSLSSPRRPVSIAILGCIPLKKLCSTTAIVRK